MRIYIVILILIITSSYKSNHRITKMDKFTFFIMAIISGLRYYVGTDFHGYITYFNRISQGDKMDVELGFKYIVKLLPHFGLGYQSMFFIFSLMTMWFTYKGFEYYLKNVRMNKLTFYVCMLLFIYFPSFNGIRQLLSGSIIFFASQFAIEKDSKKYITYFALAISFHYSSLALLPIYYIDRVEFSKKNMILLFLLSFAISLPIMRTFIDNAVMKLGFTYIGVKFQRLYLSEYNQRSLSLGLTSILNITIFMLSYTKSSKNMNRAYNFSKKMYYINIIIILASISMPLLTRFIYFFNYFMVIGISAAFDYTSLRYRKIIRGGLMIGYVGLTLIVLIQGNINNDSDYIPYQYNLDFTTSSEI